MTRTYSDLCNDNIRAWLETLADKSVEPEQYKNTMKQIGESLGDCILSQIDDFQSDVYLASTVEDADFLAKGMIYRLEKHISKFSFACFWNQRFSPFEIEDLKVAPILKKYQEPSNEKVKYLIVIKSIISGACVVRTNLVNLIQKIEPEKIFIVAPVIYYKAEDKLRNEFEENIYNKFQFIYFAQDDERTPEGEVIPGIGGNVYQRLGFESQLKKNEYIPEIVKQRRSNFVRSNKASTLSEFNSNNSYTSKTSPITQKEREVDEQFLQEVLKALEITARSNSDPQIIYPLLTANTNKLNSIFLETLRFRLRNNLAHAESDKATSITRYIGNFSNPTQKLPLGSKANNTGISNTGGTRTTLPQDWAIMPDNLGISYRKTILVERADSKTGTIINSNSELNLSDYVTSIPIRQKMVGEIAAEVARELGKQREQTRSRLGTVSAYALGASLLLMIFINFSPNPDEAAVKNLISQTLIPLVTTLLGFTLGFYFGGNKEK